MKQFKKCFLFFYTEFNFAFEFIVIWYWSFDNARLQKFFRLIEVWVRCHRALLRKVFTASGIKKTRWEKHFKIIDVLFERHR